VLLPAEEDYNRCLLVVVKVHRTTAKIESFFFLFKKYLPGWIKLITLLPSRRVPTKPDALNMERW
jgi:hypothetical protein